ncbi:MAG: aldehyde dehydrogenase EutE [Synergistaceae bacterium]|jgi:propionaldehyde dehydrogenase|nr:aldehyde dehydrogenase EutE [Synergistaceae bacterium]
MALSEAQIRQLVNEAILEAGGAEPAEASYRKTAAYSTLPEASGQWLCDDADEAISNAKRSQMMLAGMSLEHRGRIISAMREAAYRNAEALAELAHNETGYGRVEHKILKNRLAATNTPGIEDLHPVAYSGDNGLTIVEGAPFGVIGSITPSTNPTSTVINNSISMIAAGNSVVYNPHPSAKNSSTEAMRVLNEAVVSVGGPPALMTTVRVPTPLSGTAIMSHKDVKLLSITGGEAVVSVAMKSGKKVIAAGPGNPPVIADNTAFLPQAAKDIVDGASFDNNVLCVAEKEVFVFDDIAGDLMSQMIHCGAQKVSGADIDKIVNTVFEKRDGRYVINRNFVGRSASYILRQSGVSSVGEPRLVIAEVDKYHPLVMTEMLMPVLPIVRVKNIDEAIEEALRAEQGYQHSAMIHSTNIRNMSAAAAALNTTIFVKNAPSYSGLGFGGEGYATLTIATPTGEGLTSAKSFTRARRCVLKGDFRIV